MVDADSPVLVDVQRRRWRLVCWLLLALVSALACLPGGTGPVILPISDKLQHVAAFAALAAAALLAGPPTRRHALVVLGLLLGYGLLIEAVQTALPGRTAEWGDVLADLAGIAAGQAAAFWWRGRHGSSAGRLT